MNLNNVPLVGWIAAFPDSSGTMPIQLAPGMVESDVEIEFYAQNEEDRPDIDIYESFEGVDNPYGPCVVFTWNNKSDRMIPFDYRINIK